MVEGSPSTEKLSVAPELVGAKVFEHRPADGKTIVVHPETGEHMEVESAAWLAAHSPDSTEGSADFFNAEPPPSVPEAAASQPPTRHAIEVVAEIPNGDITEVGVPQEISPETPVVVPEVRSEEPAQPEPGPQPLAEPAAAEETPPEPEVTVAEETTGPTQPENNAPSQESAAEQLEKWRDQNIDPRVILKLKENLAERLQGANDADQSFKKVQTIRTVTRHLLAQGLPIAENGDFEPEGMELLRDMTSMMELSDGALQRLSSNKAGPEPLIVEPNDQEIVDFINKRNEENRANISKRAEPSVGERKKAERKAAGKPAWKIEFPLTKEKIKQHSIEGLRYINKEFKELSSKSLETYDTSAKKLEHLKKNMSQKAKKQLMELNGYKWNTYFLIGDALFGQGESDKRRRRLVRRAAGTIAVAGAVITLHGS